MADSNGADPNTLTGGLEMGTRSRDTLGEEVAPDPIDTGNGGSHVEPQVHVLRAGQTLRYVDSSGDRVRIAFSGRGGRATITFTGSDANGSDIASVELEGVRRGGRLAIRSNGEAEVDKALPNFAFDLLIVDGHDSKTVAQDFGVTKQATQSLHVARVTHVHR